MEKSRVKVVAYIGNGEKRVDFEGEVDRVDIDERWFVPSSIFVHPGVITITYFEWHSPKFRLVVWTPTKSLKILKFVKL